MTAEERDDLLSNTPPEENLAAKYEHLLHAFEEQGRTMKKVARNLRDICAVPEGYEWSLILGAQADELDPPEPLAEADAAEKFAKDCAARKK